VVNLRKISGKTATGHPEIPQVFREANPTAVASQRAAAVLSGGRRAGLTSLRSAILAPGSGTVWSAFPAITLGEQIGLLGSDQGLQPPDTQLAAGPTAVLEATNDSLTAWSKTGEFLAAADMNVFFNVPVTQGFGDPRLLYDNQSQRWILSGWSVDNSNNSQTYLAVSATSDPTGNWNVYTLNSFVSAMTSTATETDQPMTGVCDDKVVMSWNEYTGTGAGTFTAVQTLVLDKSQLLSGSTPDWQLLAAPESGEFRLVPAQSMSPTTTCYMTTNNADGNLSAAGSSTAPKLGVIAITGLPSSQGGGTVAQSETDLALTAPTNPPPAPAQPGGTVEAAGSNDDRLLGAVWQNGVLWTSATDGCTPLGDNAMRNCLRLWKVNAPATGSPTLALDTDLSQVGGDEYYPAVGVDSAGDLFVSYTASSSGLDPSLDAVVSPGGTGTFDTPVTIEPGLAAYNGTGTPPTVTARWGDYSAVAADPTASGAVWVAGEYAPSDAASGDWGTAAGLVSLSAAPASATAVGVEGTNGQLFVQTPQLGSGWHSLGGGIVGPPAVAAEATAFSGAPAQPLFVATGTNKSLFMRTATAGWQAIAAAKCIGSPGAVAYNGTLTVACRGTNNALFYNSVPWSGTGLPAIPASGWKSLGGTLSASPAVAPVGGAVTFFVRGTTGKIFTRTVSSGYVAHTWGCIGAPAAGIETASNDTIFACQGTDRALWISFNGGSLQKGALGGWLPAFSLGGTLIGGPAVAAGSLVTEWLVEGTNKAIFQDSSVTGSSSLGGGAVNGVGAAALN